MPTIGLKESSVRWLTRKLNEANSSAVVQTPSFGNLLEIFNMSNWNYNIKGTQHCPSPYSHEHTYIHTYWSEHVLYSETILFSMFYFSMQDFFNMEIEYNLSLSLPLLQNRYPPPQFKLRRKKTGKKSKQNDCGNQQPTIFNLVYLSQSTSMN